ncbi:MAG: ABC transporter permease [Clostridia bacterium]|nr:ABC transporter permease [Clostridia bacterium]
MNTIINFFFAAVRSGTPLLFGTTGEILTQKSGSLNLGVEGLMYMGAFAGFFVAYKTGNLLLALLGAFLFGVLGALVYAFLTVTLQANQNVTGLALTIFGTGVAQMLGFWMIQSNDGLKPIVNDSMMRQISDSGIPYLRDIPVIGKMFFSYNVLVYLALIIAVLVWFYLNKTRAGLNVCAVGENPAAADASGLAINRIKYVNIMIGGGICGLGGAYISLINGIGNWDNNCVSGQGWISVALVIFAAWNPAKAILGSLLFGAFTALQIRAADFAAEFSFLSFMTKIPSAVYQMLPFVITAVILIISSIRQKKEGNQPAACGINYYREER